MASYKRIKAADDILVLFLATHDLIAVASKVADAPAERVKPAIGLAAADAVKHD